jgi:uncharacterized protein YukE
MAAEMPVRVEPIEGAVRVDYPWSAATTAVGALNDAVSTLDTQLATRAEMLPLVDEWEGAYGTEFNQKQWLLEQTGIGLKEGLTTLASSIVTGAEDANTQQRQNNDRAALAYRPGDLPPVGSPG